MSRFCPAIFGRCCLIPVLGPGLTPVTPGCDTIVAITCERSREYI
jgi:hypothetical protein